MGVFIYVLSIALAFAILSLFMGVASFALVCRLKKFY
tara:strand:- start:322 stop:432 length:111 start_codon:yes stop_codon:yes gene_type:complete